jgi:hypothetical protein
MLVWLPCYDAPGVAAGVFPILLFLLLGFGAVADLGVFSADASFLSPPTLVLMVGPFIVPSAGGCVTCGGGTGFLPVDARWNSPGRPVMGFSSTYSPPYRICIMKASSAARSSETSSFFWLAGAGVGFAELSGMGVSGLDSAPLGRVAEGWLVGSWYTCPCDGRQVLALSATGRALAMAEEMVICLKH